MKKNAIHALPLLLLTGAAVLGNMVKLQLFYNVDFIFGSIFVLLGALLYGPRAAAAVGFFSSLYTWVLWNHPYAVIIFTLEAVVVSLLYSRRNFDPILAAILYWLTAGIGLVFLFYRGIMHLPLTATTLIMSKQAINGILNAVLAYLLYALLFKLPARFSPITAGRELRFSRLLQAGMAAFVLIPTLLLTVIHSKEEPARLQQLKFNTMRTERQLITAQLQLRFKQLRQIMRTHLPVLRTGTPPLPVFAHITGAVPEVTGCIYLRNGTVPVSDKPFSSQLINELQRSAPLSNRPSVLAGNPPDLLLQVQDRAGNRLFCRLDSRRILLELETGMDTRFSRISLLDSKQRIFAATASGTAPGSKLPAGITPMEKENRDIFVHIPENLRNISVMRRWEKSVYYSIGPVDPQGTIRLAVSSALGPFLKQLHDRYNSALFLILVLILVLLPAIAVFIRRILYPVTLVQQLSHRLPERIKSGERMSAGHSHFFEFNRLLQNFNAMRGKLETHINQLNRTNRQLSREKDRAEAANYEKSRFVANMSHEIRTPISGILGMTRLLLKTALTPEQQEWLQLIMDSGSSLLDIINDILDISKIEAGKIELDRTDFDLHELIHRTLKPLQLEASSKTGIDFLIHIPEHLPHLVCGDPKRIRQVLTNLTANALKFTERGAVSIEAESTGNMINLIVRDTGIGIPYSKQEAVFRSFTQAEPGTARKYGGTGLGLTISRHLARLMGGDITLSSTPGKGSVFTFSFAYTPGSALIIETAPETGSFPESLNILLAEDDLINRKYLTELLRRLGHTVTAAVNGLDLLQIFEQGGDYDAIILDMNMPDLNGRETARRIREAENRHHRIIILTASVLTAGDGQYYSDLYDVYLTKPVGEKDLLQALHDSNSEQKIPPAAAQGAAAVFDRDAFKQRYAELPRELELEVVTIFIEELPDRLERITRFGEAGDTEKMLFALHSLKSVSANLYAVKLTRTAELLEDLVRMEGTARAVRELERLRSDAAETREALLASFSIDGSA